MDEVAEFVSEHEAGYIPRDKIVMVCTGCQGEGKSALARIAREEHPQVSLEAGDAVIFSSRAIPGNEKMIFKIQTELIDRGIHVITDEDEFVHVSGHACRDEIIDMYNLIRPKISIPVHGERYHLYDHAELAKSCQVPFTIIPNNGDLIRLTAKGPEITDQITTGVLGVDGKSVIPLRGEIMKERHKMKHAGSAFVTLVLDDESLLVADPKITVKGLLREEDEKRAIHEMVDLICDAIDDLHARHRHDDEQIRQAARVAVRRYLNNEYGKKPVTDVHLIRV
jgi:ribonuclease J